LGIELRILDSPIAATGHDTQPRSSRRS
jgi:hypothetical protein